jgi:hypothetical protein
MNLAEQIDGLAERAAPAGDFTLAKVTDAFELSALFGEFFAESDYSKNNIRYSQQNAMAWLLKVLGNGSFPHIIARVDNKIVGVISWSMDQSFCEEPVAVLHTIYVKKPYRKSIMGRMLVSLALDLAQYEGACSFSAPIASGMKEMKSLANMFTKAGFKQSGVILTKAFN